MTEHERLTATAQLDDAWLGFVEVYASAPGGQLHQEPDCLWYAIPIDFPAFSGAACVRMSADDALRRVDEVRRALDGRPHAWFVNTLTTPANLNEILASAGSQGSVALIGMAMRLSDLAPPPELPAGIEVRRPVSAEEAREFAHITAELFEAPLDGWVDQLADTEAALFEAGGGLLRSAAFSGGSIVAASGFTLRNGVAALQTLSTLPDWRNRGIGGAIATAELMRLREQGCHTSVVWANPAARSLYERMGYREVCTGHVVIF